MRLAAQVKMGYYPTPETLTPIITKYLNRHIAGPIRILDPCAGEGTAVRHIADHLNAEPYGIEIDIERGTRAKHTLAKCLVTDYQNTKISHHSFSLLYLNPPYDWAVRNTELEGSERFERTFLRDCIAYICSKGILVYLIPQKRLDGYIARMLSYRFEDISVFRFPEAEYKAFKQLVILGVMKKKPLKDDETAGFLKDCGNMLAVVPFLPAEPSHIYEVPISPSKPNFMFRSKDIDPDELADEIRQYGLFQQFTDMTIPLRMAEKIRPIMPLRHGHLAQILACGLMNGLVWNQDKRSPLLVKGITRKKVKHSVEKHGNVEKHIQTDQINIVIHAFDRFGEMLTIK